MYIYVCKYVHVRKDIHLVRIIYLSTYLCIYTMIFVVQALIKSSITIIYVTEKSVARNDFKICQHIKVEQLKFWITFMYNVIYLNLTISDLCKF